MAVTRSTAAERAVRQPLLAIAIQGASRAGELIWLFAASLILAGGLALVYQAKTAAFDTLDPKLLHLGEVTRREQLLPYLTVFPGLKERQLAAREIFNVIRDAEKLPNVGALARIRQGTRPVFSGNQFREFKRQVIVRRPADFQRSLALWAALYFSAFYAVHLFWRFRRFTGDTTVLPALHLLTGIGLVLMVSLRDPLRDTLSFAEFAQSVVLACAGMAALSQLDYSRLLGRYSFVPLLGSLLLSAALILFGSGPGTSDAKVNLLGFQPVEGIKILLIFFLAGYFARRWEQLRSLKENRPEFAQVARHIEIPRLEYALPVVIALALSLVFFFLQKDLGPALIIACSFLAMYAIARNRAFLAACGLLLLSAGFAAGYWLGIPRTVHNRVEMWISPWDNAVRGGEQVVHALWALAAGGLFGTGLGLGDPDLLPAGHTDLILAALGEEWGFAGVLAVFAIYVVLAALGLRIALHAKGDYAFFLALGLTLLIAFQVLLIAAGVLDLAPLSGVVTPFLSYGGTSMLANFAIFAMLLSLSREQGDRSLTAPFHQPVRRLTMLLAGLSILVIGKAAWVQVVRADAVLGAGTLTVQADGARRYQYNPRLTTIARNIPRGTIYDRNGIPLATSRWELIEEHRRAYAGMGIVIDPQTQGEERHYPLAGAAFHLLGDLRTRANWSASNSSLQERDSIVRLQGYDDRARVVEVANFRAGQSGYAVRYDYRELFPLLRYRYRPDHPDVKSILERERDVRMSIDARLQMRAARILRSHLKKLKKQKGAVVILNPDTGELLAAVSHPWPQATPDGASEELLDRARYGLYPPGSTFKIVTAMAALRLNPALANQTFECKRLPDGRVGNYVRGWGRPIRDDIADKTPHGIVNMEKAVTVSCNAYFAQLALQIGPDQLLSTANLLGIAVARPNTAAQLRDALPQAGYGQGQVVASPLQMARAAATIAAHGKAPYGHWVMDDSNARVAEPQPVLPTSGADLLARSMRLAVAIGTGRAVASAPVPIAGKTGTAEIEKGPSHAWFIGMAPYGAQGKRVAFAVIVENGQYGGSAAAPIAGALVAAAAELK